MRTTIFIFLVGAAALLAACSPYNPDLGNAPYLCAMAEPFCPEGYFCQTTTEPAPRDRICVSEGGLMPDSMQTGFPCANDSNLEGGSRNDTPMTAYQTPVDTQRLDMTLADLALCPAGDKDHYAVTLSAANAMKAIEVIVSWDSGQPISMSLLNAGGTALVNGTANGEKSLRACAPNLPAATYHGAVFATGQTQNNYRLSIKVLPNCAQ
jgi:hypothetical protein